MAEKSPKDPAREDRKTRIEQLKHRAKELAGGQMISFASDNRPSAITEKFWEHVVAFEQAQRTTLFDMLVNGGLSLPSPAELDDAQLTAKLWEVINGMALLDTYLHNTNHLTDRELYEYLWNDALREEVVLQLDNPDFVCHLDLVGSGSKEDTLLYLRYYAGEDERRWWLEEWPDDALPDREQAPFDRDRQLPAPDRLGLTGHGKAS
jgi:hypothetical protein